MKIPRTYKMRRLFAAVQHHWPADAAVARFMKRKYGDMRDRNNFQGKAAEVYFNMAVRHAAFATRGEVTLKPIRRETDKGNYTFDPGPNGSVNVYDDLGGDVKEIDNLLLVDGCPVLCEVKMRGLGEGKLSTAFNKEKIKKQRSLFGDYFEQRVGYAVVVPKDLDLTVHKEVSREHTEVFHAQRRFRGAGGIVVPFKFEFEAYRERMTRLFEQTI
ncbi:MAG: hypothetical protein OXR66_00285 [Candidatus Woesearchaeota archaeon]|nr:hypothetical protein [Candidatus Woesearchaeota archaeon]